MGFGKNNTGVIIRDTASDASIASLASRAAVSIGVIAIAEDFRLLKAEVHMKVELLAAGEQILVGISDAELTVAEIAECLDAAGPLNRNDNLSNERAMRPVWLFDVAPLTSDEGGHTAAFAEWKKRWTFSSPTGWRLFAYNPSGGALSAASQIISTQASYYGLWLS